MRLVCLVLALVFCSPALAEMAPRAGWAVLKTNKPFETLVEDTRAAAKANGLAVVTQAGPTAAAKRRGIAIPGNRVIGVFNNDFAVRTLARSTAAMIEAPIRLYVTENPDGTSTLSYKTPSLVFAPYFDEGGPELQAIAAELDLRFETIALTAIR